MIPSCSLSLYNFIASLSHSMENQESVNQGKLGAFHSTKKFWFKLPSFLPDCCFIPIPIPDLESLFLAFELLDDFHLLGYMLGNNNELVDLSSVSCLMGRNLNMNSRLFCANCFENILPDQFKHQFRK